MKRVQVTTVNQDEGDFDYLFSLWTSVRSSEEDIVLAFDDCGFLRQNAVAFLGGVAESMMTMGRKITFDWQSMRSPVQRNLDRNGFCAYFGAKTRASVGNAISFRHDRSIADHDDVIRYLSQDWLGRGWINVSEGLSNRISGRVWEVYENAFEHSGSPVGAFSCGQYYPNLKSLCLSIVDFGKGIPANVRSYLRRPRLLASDALEWAFSPGTTTSPIGTGRGLGLDLIKSFITVNRGYLDMYSNDGRAVLNPQGANFTNRKTSFGGTILSIMIRCDEKYYALASEIRRRDLF